MRACSWLSGEVANAQESSRVMGIPPRCPHDLYAGDAVMERPNAAPQPHLEAEAQRTLEGVGCRRLFGKALASWAPAPGVPRTFIGSPHPPGGAGMGAS